MLVAANNVIRQNFYCWKEFMEMSRKMTEKKSLRLKMISNLSNEQLYSAEKIIGNVLTENISELKTVQILTLGFKPIDHVDLA
jgi:hypothetical protein